MPGEVMGAGDEVWPEKSEPHGALTGITEPEPASEAHDGLLKSGYWLKEGILTEH